MPQSGDVSLAPKLTSTTAASTGTQPALAIGRRARGVTPEPGAWTTLDGQRVKLEPVGSGPAARSWTPGTGASGRKKRPGGDRVPRRWN